jgi:hypothetical protein
MNWTQPVFEPPAKQEQRPLHERASRGGIGKPTPRNVLALIGSIAAAGAVAYILLREPGEAFNSLSTVPFGGPTDDEDEPDSPADRHD